MIAPRSIAERLMSPQMWNGWGIRTLADDERAYDPMSYHCGTVWPHDGALCAAGLKAYGFDDEALDRRQRPARRIRGLERPAARAASAGSTEPTSRRRSRSPPRARRRRGQRRRRSCCCGSCSASSPTTTAGSRSTRFRARSRTTCCSPAYDWSTGDSTFASTTAWSLSASSAATRRDGARRGVIAATSVRRERKNASQRLRHARAEAGRGQLARRKLAQRRQR